jgi:hypothetical protein
MIAEASVRALPQPSEEITMRMTRFSLVLLLVLATTCVGAHAQEAAATTEPVLSHIPAGAMGYIVVNDVRATGDNIDRFIQSIGLGPMVQNSMPEGFLKAMLERTPLGEGFNPDAGLAVAVLDFQQFGFDIMQFMPGGAAAAGESEGPPPMPPVVIWVPGSSTEGLFGQYEMAPAGDYTRVMFPNTPPMLATEQGGYTVLSLRADVLDAVTAGGETADSILDANETMVVGRSDIAVHLNMRVAGPVFDKLLRMVEQQMAAAGAGGGPGMGPMMGPGASPEAMQKMLGWYRELLAQVDSATLTGRFVDEGLVFEELVSYVPDSALAQAVAAYQPAESGLLDRLPDMPYVLALGTRGGSASIPQEQEMLSAYLDMLSGSMPPGTMTEDDQAEVLRIANGLNEQVGAMQMVIGGGPEAGGVFSLGVVMDCDNAEATRGLLRDAFGVGEEVIKGMVPGGQAQNLQLNFAEGAEVVAGTSVDVIEFTDPGVEQMPEQEKQQMSSVLGEPKIQVRIASPDEKTVVLTFGGADAFMEQALQQAAGGGSIPTQPGTQTAMKYMPENPTGVLLFNLKNLGTVIQQGAQKMGMAESMPPLNFTADTPLAAGGAVVGESSVHATFFVPSDAVQNVVQTAMMFMMGGMGGTGPGPGGPGGEQPMEGGEDF